VVTQFMQNFQILGKKSEKRWGKGIDTYAALFLSMLSSTEFYTTNNISKKKKKSSGLLSITKRSFNKLLPKKEEGIERLVSSDNALNTNSIISTTTDKNYNSTSSPFSQFLKNLYASFANYGKKAYISIGNNSKKIAGEVRITLSKFINLGEYIMCLVVPSCRKARGSPFDFDTHAQEVSAHESISEESEKYVIGYHVLRYRD